MNGDTFLEQLPGLPIFLESVLCVKAQVQEGVGYSSLVADLLAEHKAFLMQFLCGFVFPQHPGRIAQIMEGIGYLFLVADFSEHGQAFLKQLSRRSMFPLAAGNVSQTAERNRDSPAVADLSEDGQRFLARWLIPQIA